MEATYALSMGLFLVIIITIKVVLISIKVAMIAMLLKALLIVAMISLCYSLWRMEMPKPIICDWCGNGITVKDEFAIRLHITKLDYIFDTNECLVKWLYSRMIIKLDSGEKLREEAIDGT